MVEIDIIHIVVYELIQIKSTVSTCIALSVEIVGHVILESFDNNVVHSHNLQISLISRLYIAFAHIRDTRHSENYSHLIICRLMKF